jgi:hypothetical protein
VKRVVLVILLLSLNIKCFCWGFFAHKKINNYAVYLLPPEMIGLYKKNIEFISEHAVDPDRRRNVMPEEAPRHYIDIDHYGKYPFVELPRIWDSAIAKYGKDTLMAYGIAPWNVLGMLTRLTEAFKEKNLSKILKTSADMGHYIADAHVPLHCCINHNGLLTDQKGIHAFWESRIPELLADKEFDFFIGKAEYIKRPGEYIWARVLESAKAADSVLTIEKELSRQFATDKKYAYEQRNGVMVRQYSSAYTVAYNDRLNGMVERRMRLAIASIASFWYTAWVNAGQPNLTDLAKQKLSETDIKELDQLNESWKNGKLQVREHE